MAQGFASSVNCISLLRGCRALAAVAFAALVCACGRQAPVGFQGYIEGEFVNLASPFAGQLQKLHARRGSQVSEGQPVFVLEQANEAAARVEEEQKLKSAEAKREIDRGMSRRDR